MARYLVTAALPYANGPIHLGHLLEHIQADVYVRALRAAGHDVLYLCADDTHGTPIELNAAKRGITPEALIAESYAAHTADFCGFSILHDLYHSTHSDENRELAGWIYGELLRGGFIERRISRQMYSESLGRFLPDRLVRGTCPRCGALDQYGDVCEVCKSTYEPTDLIDPVDAIEGKRPVLRDTEQLYVRLGDFRSFLEQWLVVGVPQPAVQNFVSSWLSGELKDWCISRDAPYFGFEIPGEPGKYFYVWMDAPVGYIATTAAWAAARGRTWRQDWDASSETRIVHVIGKDIVYFHTLFWPAMLRAAGLKAPDRVHVHGMLTVDGQKMSKSRGTFVRASTYLQHLDPDYLRYYFAAKLSDSIDDIDLNLEDFVTRVNAELVNNVVNLCSRVTKFVATRLGGVVPAVAEQDLAIGRDVHETLQVALDAYAAVDSRAAIRAVVELSDRLNLFFQEAEPWKLLKSDPVRAAEVCAVALHGCTGLMYALAPVVPGVSQRFAAALGLESIEPRHLEVTWRSATVASVERLLERVDLEKVQAMIEASKDTVAAPQLPVVEVEAFKPEISIEEFNKVDLRVGVVESAEAVPEAEKLIRLIVHCGRRIQVFAGVRSAYPDPTVLVGRRVLVLANLKPRKMRFGMSEGMLLATSAEDGAGLQLVHPDDSALGGWTVR
jgi:methionyl-tRNA synthetase